MTDEEKIKAYDEAVEKAKQTLKASSSEYAAKTVVYYFFPQLCETDVEDEDEMVRKSLIKALTAAKSVGELKFILPEPTREKCIDYLERQKKKKSVSSGIIDYSYEENTDLAMNGVGFIDIGAGYMNNRSRDEVVSWLKSVPKIIRNLQIEVENLKRQKRG